MGQRLFLHKGLSVALISLFVWTFMVFMPHEDIKELGIQFGTSGAYAGVINVPTGGVTPPSSTDLSEPARGIKYSFARVRGREEAVYLNIPSNQLDKVTILPIDPSPMVLGKYDPSTSTGTLTVMRMRRIGASIQAEIVRLTPQNFQNSMSPSLYNFAFLDWNGSDPSCIWSQKALGSGNPPDVNNGDIINQFMQYDRGTSSYQPTLIFTPSEQAAINTSSYYWHQRLNNDSCFTHYGLKDYDTGDGSFHNISETGFFKMAALAMRVHKAAAMVVAEAHIDPVVSTSTSGGFFKKKVTTTVQYWLTPRWYVGTPVVSGTYSEIMVNPTFDNNGWVSILSVKGNHTFPVDRTLMYQWSKSESGWTGLFVFIAIVVVSTLAGAGLGGFSVLDLLAGTEVQAATAGAVGGGIGAIGGLMASGFSPSTNTVANFTPFIDSSHSLDPSINASGDAAIVAQRTFANWISPDIMNTPGGVQVFAGDVDIRRALACGGASRATDACSAPAITQIGFDDPRFNQVYNEMFTFPNKELQKYKYPWTTK